MSDLRAFLVLWTINFTKSFHDVIQFLRGGKPQPATNPVRSKGSDQADFNPRLLRQIFRTQIKGQRETRSLRLTRDLQCNHRTGSMIKSS